MNGQEAPLDGHTLLVVEALQLHAGAGSLARCLRVDGFAVVQAQSSRDALQVLEGAPGIISLLLVDLAPEHLDAPQFLADVWAREPELPVLFASSTPVEGVPGEMLLSRRGPEDVIRRVRDLL
jgi:DNA-binding NtrC family response regulator